MSCCGKMREQWLHQPENAGASPAGNGSPAARPDVYFEYTGETGLTAVGSFTRNRYRFSGKGDRQGVDHRDAGGMMALPLLQRVRQA